MSDQTPNSSLPAAYARLLSLAVHEFRTPASVIGGYLRMLQRDDDQTLTDRQRKMVDEAEKSCARLVALVNELSEVAKLDGGTAPVKQEAFDLFTVIQEVAEGMHEAGDREVHLVVRGESAGAPMTGDLTRLRSAFGAFFRAILREQPVSGEVVVDRRRATQGGENSAVIVVASNADVQRAYDAPPAPFDEKRGGLGLTLPIALRVIERHRGRVWSPAVEGTGGRSAVIVSLPLGTLPEQSR